MAAKQRASRSATHVQEQNQLKSSKQSRKPLVTQPWLSQYLDRCPWRLSGAYKHVNVVANLEFTASYCLYRNTVGTVVVFASHISCEGRSSSEVASADSNGLDTIEKAAGMLTGSRASTCEQARLASQTSKNLNALRDSRANLKTKASQIHPHCGTVKT